MITELEKEFFNVFGIEPIPIKSYGYWLIKGSIAENDKGEKVVYPKITDRVLLKLIIIAMNYGNRYRWINDTSNVEELKSETLEFLIKLAELLPHIKHQILQLFKEKQ